MMMEIYKNKKNIEELIDKTYALLPEAKKRAFVRHQQYNKKLKKEEAEKIIHMYAAVAGTTALSPIPFSDFPLIFAEQIAMMIHIGNIYNLEISQENAKLIISTLGGTVASGLAARFLANALKFVPGAGSIAGGTINSGVAVATTEAMGKTLVAVLDDNYENLGNDIINILIDTIKSKI